MKGPPTARAVAARVIVRVLRDDAFAAAALDAELGTWVQLSDADRGLATELVYGALRRREHLESLLDAHSKRPVRRSNPLVFAHLLLGAYQITSLTRVPAFAAVSEAVKLVRQERGEAPSRYVNALLRRVARAAEASTAGSGADGRVEASPTARLPPWLLDALSESLGGIAEARAYASSALERPPTGVRVHAGFDVDDVRRQLAAERPKARIEIGQIVPRVLKVWQGGDLRETETFASGACSLQEEGSVAVALALGACPGETVLDACAGRGNKTRVLMEAVRAEGHVVATDVHAKKLEALRREADSARWPMPKLETRAVDLTAGTPDLGMTFDAVLVDAPCTGTGTLARRPDILARRRPEDIDALAAKQLAIVRAALPLVRPGGRLVYAVCSVLRAESEAVVGQALLEAPELELRAMRCPGLGGPFGASPIVRLLPSEHGTDGYFIAQIARKS